MKLNCQHCKTAKVDESHKLACGRVICGDCMSTNASKKRFKCSKCDSFHPKGSTNEATTTSSFSSNDSLNDEFKSILNEIQTKLTKTEFDLKNGENVIVERCIELRKQVQLAKELKTQEINKLGESMIKDIDRYEKESLKRYVEASKQDNERKLNQLKQEVSAYEQRTAQLKGKIAHKTLDMLKEIKSRVVIQENEINHSMFHKKQLMVYHSTEDRLCDEALGSFSYYSLGHTVNVDEIVKKDFSSAFYRIVSGCGVSGSVEVLNTKLLPKNNLVVLFHKLHHNYYSNITRYDSSYLYLLNENGILLSEFELVKRSDEEDIILPGIIYTSNDKICVNYVSDSGYFILILSFDLEMKKHTFLMDYYKLVGASDEKLYFQSKRGEHALHIYDWNVECIAKIGQRDNKDEPHYYPNDLEQVFAINSNNKNYFVLLIGKIIQIVDATTGVAIKTINEDDVVKIDIDSNNNILVYRTNETDEIVYYNLDGFCINKVKLSIKKRFSIPIRNCYLNKSKNTFYYFDGDSYEFAFLPS